MHSVELRCFFVVMGVVLFVAACGEPGAELGSEPDARPIVDSVAQSASDLAQGSDVVDGDALALSEVGPLLDTISTLPDSQHPGPEPSLQSAVSIVRIDTHGVVVDEQRDQRPWVDVSLALTEVNAASLARFESAPTWQGRGAIHVRGNSSVDYEKKQYALEIRDDQGEDAEMSPFGMPEEEDWVLQAPYADKTLMRNHLMYHWSRAIGRYAPRTHFVELYLEDQGGTLGPEDYRGVYVFMEKIKRDKHRVDVASMSKDDDALPQLSGGYVLKRDWLEGHEVITERYGDELVLEYPKPDKITEAQRRYIQDYLNDFESALERADGSHRNYADIDSFADHMLLVELSRDVDGYVLSTHMSKARDGLLTMGPIWDFNGALGNADYFESWRTEGWHYENPEFPADNPNGFRWYEQLLNDADYRERLASRWREHRAGPWSDAQLLADIDAVAALLEEAQRRNFERWPVLGQRIWPNDSDALERDSYQQEIEHLKSWLMARAAWLDTQFGASGSAL